MGIEIEDKDGNLLWQSSYLTFYQFREDVKLVNGLDEDIPGFDEFFHWDDLEVQEWTPEQCGKIYVLIKPTLPHRWDDRIEILRNGLARCYTQNKKIILL